MITRKEMFLKEFKKSAQINKFKDFLDEDLNLLSVTELRSKLEKKEDLQKFDNEANDFKKMVHDYQLELINKERELDSQVNAKDNLLHNDYEITINGEEVKEKDPRKKE